MQVSLRPMPRSRKVLPLAGIHSFNTRSWKATCLNSYAFSLSVTGEKLLTHVSLLWLQWAGQLQPWGAGWLAEVRGSAWLSALAEHTGSKCSGLVYTRSHNKRCRFFCYCRCDGSELCLAVVSCPRCKSCAWVSTKSWDDAFSFAILCLWLDCSCLPLVLQTVYLNHANKTFLRNGPLNRII